MEVVVKIESEAVCAVVLVAVCAEESLLLPLSHDGAVTAFNWAWILFGDHHAFILVLAARSISFEAVDVLANSDSFLLSLEFHHFFRKEFNNIQMVGLQFLHVIILEALMLSELASSKLFNANLALDHNLWAESLNMVP